MELAGHTCVGFCEWDKFAAASYTSMHLITDEQREFLATLDKKKRQKEILKDEYRNGEWYASDIRTVRATDLPESDCWCFGAPCLVAGTLITTKDGMKPIETVEVGDYVLTHANTYEKATERMVNRKTGIYTIKVKGSPITEVTGNHRFYVRYRHRFYKDGAYHVNWDLPEWKAVEDFNGNEYIAFPYNTESTNEKGISDQEAWLIGRYVADGYLRDTPRKDRPSNIKRVVFCIGTGKYDEFESHALSVSYSKGENCRKYQMSDKRLYELCEQCGKGAENKRIPGFIMDLPTELLKEFIDGYMSGDGSVKNGIHKATSVSRELIYQLGQCVSKVYGCGYSIHYTKRPDKYIICGREVNQRDTWQIVWRDSGEKQSHMLHGVLWQKLKKISFDKDRTETVYNLEVENEHSYTANNMGLHNCQDFSVAGNRAGLEGERSSLIREIFRLLEETREEDRPEWLLYENVKGMLSSNRGFDFLAILLEMDRWGYDIEWQLFNSKYHGVPQNRERVYTVGHLRTCGSRKIFPVTGTGGEDCVEVEQVAQLYGTEREPNPQAGRVYDPNGVSPTMDTCSGGNRMPKIGIDIVANYPSGNQKSGIFGEGGGGKDTDRNGLQTAGERGIEVVGNINPSGKGMNGNVFFSDGISPAVTTNKGEGNKVAQRL